MWYKPAGDDDFKELYPLVSNSVDDGVNITLSGTYQGHPVATVAPNATKKFTIQVTPALQLHLSSVAFLMNCKHYGTLALGNPADVKHEEYRVVASAWKHSKKGLSYGKLLYTFDITFDTVDDNSWKQT
jgi:hypothetical protein